MRATFIAGLLVLCAGFCFPVDADAELVLKDGSVLRGTDVRLEASFYLLELESGDVVAIPSGERQRIINTGLTDLIFLCICTPPFTRDCYVDLDG